MLKLYLKQAWILLKQNPLFYTLYIVGTGLAIAMTMMMAIVYYVRLAPVYPEERRATTLYLNQMKVEQTFEGGGFSWQTGRFSHRAVTEWLRPMDGAEVVSALTTEGGGNLYVQLPDGRGDYSVDAILTDPDFFRLYTFRFTDGAAFTQDDFDGEMPRAVLTDRLARMLFGTDQSVMGCTFRMNFKQYTVCGVVEAPSRLMSHSYADLYLPYTCFDKDYRECPNEQAWEMGNYSVVMAAKSRKDVAGIRRSIDEHVQRYNAVHRSENIIMSMESGPCTHWESVMQGTAGSEGDLSQAVRHFLLILLVLLLVPSLNLSGLIASRMEGRLAEMGVRKTFGAWCSTLLHMVLWENLLLTLQGGLLGLVTAWICLYLGRGWVFTILDSYAYRVAGDAAYVSGEMLFAPIVFVSALLLCLLLNVLSAFIPAWWSLRHPIVESLYEKR